MPGARYVNPFTPQTPIGAGLQNIALALFAGQHGAKGGRAPSQVGMDEAHSELYREQARKATAERQLAERLLSAQSDDARDLVRASAAGVPIHTLRGIDAGLRGEQDLVPYTPEQMRGHRRATLAVNPTYADKTIDARNLAAALFELQKREDLEHVMGGGDATRTAQAHFAVSGKAPFDNMGGTGTFNLATGAQELNDLGQAKVGSERALGAQRTASAGLSDERTRLLVEGLFGPSVFMEGADGVVTPYFLGQVAGTGRAGARPVAPREPGNVVTETEEPLAPATINKNVSDAIVAGVRATVGGKLGDSMLEGAIVSRAQTYYRTPGSPGYGLPEESARLAVAEVLPGGVEDPWFGGLRAKGEPMLALPPVKVTGPTTKKKSVRKVNMKPGAQPPVEQPPAPAAPQGVPPPAQRVRGQTYQTPKGPMVWTGTGWVPEA